MTPDEFKRRVRACLESSLAVLDTKMDRLLDAEVMDLSDEDPVNFSRLKAGACP